MSQVHKRGFAILGVLIVVAVIGSVCFLGYTFYSQQQYAQTTDSTTEEASTVTDIPQAPAITTTSDLTEAEKTLDEIVIGEDSDASDLDDELSTF